MKICSFSGCLPASSNGPSCTVCTVSVSWLASVVAENNVLATRLLSYDCLLSPVRRAPQAQPDLLHIARIEFGDDLEAITR